jgi:hypothetical protein
MSALHIPSVSHEQRTLPVTVCLHCGEPIEGDRVNLGAWCMIFEGRYVGTQEVVLHPKCYDERRGMAKRGEIKGHVYHTAVDWDAVRWRKCPWCRRRWINPRGWAMPGREAFCCDTCRKAAKRDSGRPTFARCEGCGGTFEAKRRDARYCSGSCRQRAYRERRATS